MPSLRSQILLRPFVESNKNTREEQCQKYNAKTQNTRRDVWLVEFGTLRRSAKEFKGAVCWGFRNPLGPEWFTELQLDGKTWAGVSQAK